MSTIASPFARTDAAIDDLENIGVLDFDEYQQNASSGSMLTNALSKDERRSLFSGDGDRAPSQTTNLNLLSTPSRMFSVNKIFSCLLCIVHVFECDLQDHLVLETVSTAV